MGFKGYHCKVQSSLPAFERTRTNKHGVYEEIVFAHNSSKLVTFFPESWNEEMIRTKADEAHKPEHRISIHDQGFVGATSEGILIAFWWYFCYHNHYS